MNYATTANRPNPLAALGALGVPAAVGAVLVVGLAVTATISQEQGRTIGVFVPIEPPIEPLPPEKPVPDAKPNTSSITPQVTDIRPVPRPDTPFVFESGASDPIGTLPDMGETLGPVDFGVPDPRPSPIVDPIAASPRGNPGGWVMDTDYRPSWINRGFEGIAQFSLSIDASGRVSDCTITGSTGHAQLDRATCELVSKRARFNPARDANGEKVAGRYTNAVRWTIPE